MIARALLLSLCLLPIACHADRDRDDDEGAPLPHRVDARGRVVLSARERAAAGIEVEAAVPGTLTPHVRRFGRVSAPPDDDTAVVAPVVARLGAPAVALGAHVESGDVLVAIMPLVDAASKATLEAQQRELVGRVAGAQARVAALQSELSRVSRMVSSHLATEAARARAEADLHAEQARVESLERAGGVLAHMTGAGVTIRAPFAGVVATLRTDAGTMVQQGEVLARIVRAGTRWIDVAVPPEDPVGTAYRVESASGPVAATLESRGAVVTREGTRMDRLIVPAASAAALMPGATVPVDVLHDLSGIVLPEDAVVRRGDDRLVFTEVSPGHYAPNRVALAGRAGGKVAVSSGLSSGDRVVVRGAVFLLGEIGYEGQIAARGTPR